MRAAKERLAAYPAMKRDPAWITWDVPITPSQIADDLVAAVGPPPDGRGQTVREIMQLTGCGKDKVLARRRGLASEGRLRVSTVRRPSLDGRMTPVPAYWVRGKKGVVDA